MAAESSRFLEEHPSVRLNGAIGTSALLSGTTSFLPAPAGVRGAGGVVARPRFLRHPRPDNPRRPRARKPLPRPVSLVEARLAAGREVVQAGGNRSAWYRRVKRLMDVVGSAALLVLLSPVMLVTFVALAVTMRGRPIFRQVRLGVCGRPFVMYKFRTMRPGADRCQHAVPNEKEGPIFKNRRDPRVTRLGRFLRRTSIDELPQLVNVLLGQMSLVGPRPPIGREVEQYEPWQRRRLAVKPGLACLWKVSGRSEVGFEDWVRMDLWYVRHQSLAADLSLLVRTPLSVLSRRGAY